VKWQKALSVAGLVLVAGAAGYVGGFTAGLHPGGASTASANPSASSQTTPQTNPNLPGLTAADTKWVNGILSTPVHDSAGQVAHVSPDKPILVVAYWCPYCHKALQLLEQNHLLDKVQILAVFFNSSEGNQKPVQVTSIGQAKSLMAQALKSVGIPESKANDVLYALPSDGMDSQIQAVPDLLVQKQGTWYMLKGFVPDVRTWQQALS
jgi:thiol-disulfide isomerase/thioredoxin